MLDAPSSATSTAPRLPRTFSEYSNQIRPPRFARTNSEYNHELRPLIVGRDSMADDKDIENAENKPDSPSSFTRPTILDDPDFDGLSLYEKKALLVNRELDAHGMGKYQWYIFFLCGFGYLLDLLYAQAFGLVAPAIQQEFGFGGTGHSDLFVRQTI